MCGGGTGGETTRPILLKLSSGCAHLALCATFSSWLERGIQLSKLVCFVGVHEGVQKACEIYMMETHMGFMTQHAM